MEEQQTRVSSNSLANRPWVLPSGGSTGGPSPPGGSCDGRIPWIMGASSARSSAPDWRTTTLGLRRPRLPNTNEGSGRRAPLARAGGSPHGRSRGLGRGSCRADGASPPTTDPLPGHRSATVATPPSGRVPSRMGPGAKLQRGLGWRLADASSYRTWPQFPRLRIRSLSPLPFGTTSGSGGRTMPPRRWRRTATPRLV